MAIYRLSAQVISRSSGRSATAAAAYRAAAVIEDLRTGLVHDYARRSGVVHAEIISPDNTPAWMKDRNALWNAVEAAEKRKDAQLSREVQLALPHELNAAQRLALVRSFVARQFVARGMIADLAIHEPHRQGDNRNHHAHVMLTLREITAAGFGNKDRSWNARSVIEDWREAWAAEVNQALERAGREQRVDHRSLGAQHADAERRASQTLATNDNRTAEATEIEVARLDRDPEPKIGHIATALERRGEVTERGKFSREVVAGNLNRFHSWLAIQRKRLEQLWARAEEAIQSRQCGEKDKINGDNEIPREADKPIIYTNEEKDRYLGKTYYQNALKDSAKRDNERQNTKISNNEKDR